MNIKNNKNNKNKNKYEVLENYKDKFSETLTNLLSMILLEYRYRRFFYGGISLFVLRLYFTRHRYRLSAIILRSILNGILVRSVHGTSVLNG